MSVQPMADYRPRHSWGDARLSTTRAQLAARLIVVDAVGEPEPEYVGRHRRHPWAAQPCSRHHAGKVCASCMDLDLVELTTHTDVSEFVAEYRAGRAS